MSETAQEPREVPEGYNEVQLGPKLEVIPSDWEIESLSNWLSSLETGGRPKTSKRSESDSVLSIGGAHISDSSFDLDDPVRISEAYYEGLNSGKIEEADILLVKDGATIGKSTYVNKVPEGRAAVNSHVYILRVNHHQYDPRFLYNFIRSRTGLDQILRLTTGTAQAGLNRTFQQATKIPTPPLPEQRRIADILSTVEEQIQLTDKLIDETRELKKGLSNDLFLNGVGHDNHKNIQLGPKQFEIPQEWQIKQISEVCDDIIDYRGKTPPYSDSGIPHIRNFNIEENRLIMDDIDYVSEETYDEWMTRGIPQQGDVFFTTEAPLGKAALVPDFQFSLAQRLVVLQPGDEITGEWLMYLLTSDFMKEYYHTRATGSTVKGLSNRALQKVKVFVPPIEEQSKITNCLSNVDAKLYEELEYKEELQDLKRGLMQDLLTGKVRVNTD
jgi:type I restriction enzyme S subunit